MEALQVIIGAVVLVLVLVVGIVIKLITKKRLREMDGCGKVTDNTEKEETTFGQRK